MKKLDCLQWELVRAGRGTGEERARPGEDGGVQWCEGAREENVRVWRAWKRKPDKVKLTMPEQLLSSRNVLQSLVNHVGTYYLRCAATVLCCGIISLMPLDIFNVSHVIAVRRGLVVVCTCS